MAARLEAMGVPKYVGLTRRSGARTVWTGELRVDDAAMAAPLGWRAPRRIFVNSMSDLFHEAMPIIAMMARADRDGSQAIDAEQKLPNS